MKMKNRKFLITGGNGKTGRRIAQRLEALGFDIRIGSRSGKPAFDWYDRSTWKAALADISDVYISFQPDLAIPASYAIIDAFLTEAIKAGVDKFVLLSGRGEEEAVRVENLLMESGMNFTILRASWFNQNFSENYLLEPVLAGIVEMPSGNVPEPFIDADDIADAAVAAFTNHAHDNKLYSITGPELLTFRQAVAIISEETGRKIVFNDLTIDEYKEQLRSLDIPEDFIELIVYLYSQVMDGRNSSVTYDLETLIGRKPKRFREFAREAFVARTSESGIPNS